MESKLRPSDIVRKERNWKTNRMQTFEIDNKIIKTNFGGDYPYWDGNHGAYISIPSGKGIDKIFDELVKKGYTYIRFVCTSTRIRGYCNFYYLAK